MQIIPNGQKNVTIEMYGNGEKRNLSPFPYYFKYSQIPNFKSSRHFHHLSTLKSSYPVERYITLISLSIELVALTKILFVRLAKWNRIPVHSPPGIATDMKTLPPVVDGKNSN